MAAGGWQVWPVLWSAQCGILRHRHLSPGAKDNPFDVAMVVHHSSLRYFHWPLRHLAALITFTLVMMSYGATLNAPYLPPELIPQTGISPDIPANDDLRLYDQIAKKVSRGENYYVAVADQHRFNHYPLRPFIAVRLPTLAYVNAWLGPTGLQIASILLLLITCLAWLHRLSEETQSKGLRLFGSLLVFSCMLPFMGGPILGLHELWAGALIALSMAVWRESRPLPSILIAAFALAIRESTLPYILLMGVAAFVEHRRNEAKMWAIIVMVFGLVLFVHAQAVASVVKPSDMVSPGWVREGGLATYIAFIHQSSILRWLPMWVAAIVVPLSFLGLSSRSSRFATLALAFQFGYAIIFMLVGRADNYYWGLLVMPSLFVGLAFLPSVVSLVLYKAADAFRSRSSANGKFHKANDQIEYRN